MLPTDLLLKALLAYSVHEHQLGHTRLIEVWLAPKQIALQDDGRGMALDRPGYVENLLGTLVGQSSEVQLHGIGLSLVAAVTPSLVVQSTRGGVSWRQSFEFGVAIEPPTRLGPGLNAGTLPLLRAYRRSRSPLSPAWWHSRRSGKLPVLGSQSSFTNTIALKPRAVSPNPSIERTSSSRLRLLPAAAHVER